MKSSLTFEARVLFLNERRSRKGMPFPTTRRLSQVVELPLGKGMMRVVELCVLSLETGRRRGGFCPA